MCSTKFIESVNPEIANKLKYIGLNEFLNMVDPNNKEHYVEDNNYTSHLKMMRSYCNGDGNKLVEYKYGGDETSGRQYASSPSLQKIKREFRGALVDGIYYDFDMKNCHPSIVNYLCKKYKIKYYNEEEKTQAFGYLADYCNDREDRLQEFCDKDKISREEAKNLFLKALTTDYKIVKHKKKKD